MALLWFSRVHTRHAQGCSREGIRLVGKARAARPCCLRAFASCPLAMTSVLFGSRPVGTPFFSLTLDKAYDHSNRLLNLWSDTDSLYKRHS